MTLIILALDALDSGLVEYWDIESFRLSRHREIETFSYGHGTPHTLKVWPTVATGVSPEEHGITVSNSSDWDNPVIDFFSQFAHYLPGNLRTKLGSYLESNTASRLSISETSVPTFFDHPQRTVQNWPGVANGRELLDVWDMTNSGFSKEAFNREVLAKAAGQFGWASEMLRHDPVLAGVHIHALDVSGHAYANERDDLSHSTGQITDLRHMYEDVSEKVSHIREVLSEEDELLILSDHGMTNGLIDDSDANFGTHSFRAFAATTIDDPLPDTVFDVHDWVEKHVEGSETQEEMKMPKEQLRKLGYID